jgi:hypothetical protein
MQYKLRPNLSVLLAKALPLASIAGALASLNHGLNPPPHLWGKQSLGLQLRQG